MAKVMRDALRKPRATFPTLVHILNSRELVRSISKDAFQRPQAQLYVLINISQFAVIIVHVGDSAGTVVTIESCTMDSRARVSTVACSLPLRFITRSCELLYGLV